MDSRPGRDWIEADLVQFAILNKELVLLLRQKRLFAIVGLLYAGLALVVAQRWPSDPFLVSWAEISRTLFYTVLGCGFVLGSTVVFVASAAISSEHKRNAAQLLRVAPISSWSIIAQKTLTPCAGTWLILLGALPFLSLLFVLGGVGPDEFAYQFLNLAIWLHTAILVGLLAAAWSPKAALGERISVTILFFFAFVPSVCPMVLRGLLAVFSDSVVGDLLSGLWVLARRPLGILERLSPLWMVSSWPMNPVSTAVTAGSPPGVFATRCPALSSWLLHLLLQCLLFIGAVQGWKRGGKVWRLFPRWRWLDSLLTSSAVGKMLARAKNPFRTTGGFSMNWRTGRHSGGATQGDSNIW